MIKTIKLPLFTALSLVLFAGFAHAQETQTKVVDEVVAQVNDGVITLSRVKRESKTVVDGFVEDGKTREEAQKMVDAKQGELIANLINEELLIQKAKELGLEKEVEQTVNERLAEIMKSNNLKTVDALYAEMAKQGVDPQELKDSWRKQATREMVLQREVQAKLYWGATSKELKEYFDKHKEKFATPETVSFSEIFLSFAGRDETSVREKAKQIYTQLKAGGDWDKLLKENADPGVVTQGKGKIEGAMVADMKDVIGQPLKGLKVNDYAAPIEIDQLGMSILRVDARQQASDQSVFDENAVRLAILGEKGAEEQKTFMAKLRNEAYIKVSEAYRPLVSPLLFADERKAKTSN
ncbi:MAG TPA: peptidyl-prolyl cis-trans isomerase [Pyrinomonadaceae bacterium]|nr:peptidyl-prolyl cis-trans isomerase [Pyrinomonadaceae bacterium]